MCRKPLRISLFGVASYKIGKPLYVFTSSCLGSLLMSICFAANLRCAAFATYAANAAGAFAARPP